MVNVNEINKLLTRHFDVSGDVQIDPDSGVVNVTGDVYLPITIKISQLPVQFGVITGAFSCIRNQLASLQGAPDHVGGLFDCSRNQLSSLQHAPVHVGADFYCSFNKLSSLQHAPVHVGGHFSCSYNQLSSLQGAPDHVGGRFVITYNEQLPLLRLLEYEDVQIWDAPDQVTTIMRKYAGKGKHHILLCSNELKQAGFRSNAAW